MDAQRYPDVTIQVHRVGHGSSFQTPAAYQACARAVSAALVASFLPTVGEARVLLCRAARFASLA